MKKTAEGDNVMKNICVILLLSLMVLWLFAGAASADVDSGTVRVYLRRLVSDYPFEMDMNGDFTAKNGTMWFASGTHLVAAVQDGRICLYGNGFTLDVGNKVTFMRVSTDEDSYFLLTGLTNKYAGDLTLTIENGQIRPVMTMDIEEYVRGVVPYEVGDSFPMEAIKAQAIAARTYALAKAGQYDDADVDDTTNDQVFRGRSSISPLSEMAVRETAGIIAVRDGKPAICYYTASNGGQIEDAQHVWPRDDPNAFTYMEVKDDPYDVGNESSPVRRYVLPFTLGDNSINAEVMGVLTGAVAEKLSVSGQTVIADQIRIDTINAVELGEPKYPDSRIMTKVDLTLGISKREILETKTITVPTPSPDANEQETAPSATPEVRTEYVFSEYEAMDEPVKISIPFFGAFERAMGLSINSADNEIQTLYTTDDGFVLETRRYGHGSGMSQRGAEQMARVYRKTYKEILAFYYPGLTLETLSYPQDSRQVSTYMTEQPTPRPSPTPRPTLMPITTDDMKEGWFVAEVTNIDEDSSLNLRKSPSLSADIRMRLFKYQKLIVESQTGDGWSKVHTDAVEGYVRTEFLRAIEE